MKLIDLDVNTGFAKGNNIGYQLSRGNYIAFLNPDTVIHPNTYETSIRYLRSHPEVGAVTCKFLNPDGSMQWGFYRRFPDLSTVFFLLNMELILIKL